MIFFHGSSRCLLSLRGRKILRTRPTSRKQSPSEKIRVPAQTRIYAPRGRGQVIDPLRAPICHLSAGVPSSPPPPCEKDRNDEAALGSALPFLGKAGHFPSLPQ